MGRVSRYIGLYTSAMSQTRGFHSPRYRYDMYKVTTHGRVWSAYSAMPLMIHKTSFDPRSGRGFWGVECTLAVIGTGGPVKRTAAGGAARWRAGAMAYMAARANAQVPPPPQQCASGGRGHAAAGLPSGALV
eukprot:1191783-Prorocentrum_minimum.AAC.2